MTETLRPAVPSDEAALDALLKRSYPPLLAPDYAPDDLAALLPLITAANPDLLACGTYFVILTFDGHMVAAGGWTKTPPGREAPEAGIGHIRHVVCDPKHTRKGHARAILERAIGEARAEGLARLNCLSTLTAVPFYASLGFVEDRRIDVPIGPDAIPLPSVEMWLDL